MEEKIKSAILSRLLSILEGDSELDPKTLKDCAAVLKETTAQPGAASGEDQEEYGVIILPSVLDEAPGKEGGKEE